MPAIAPELLSHLALQDWLNRQLPDYMLPAKYLLLDSFPLSPNGKVDRTALMASIPEPSMQIKIPKTPLEKALLALWQEALDTQSISVDDNFFELGGNSITAAQIAMKLSQHLGTRFAPSILFSATTIRTLAAKIAEGNLVHE